ncbi:MAG: aminotransferase class I/II-fold pyridoxal phosphate-dependent enzyme [Candidatus Omnitrophica bacterium]|nr:aminotransferase class I/II-fold pyridoxal phosphate-dependent enzyme [Candidatus Omnitrophota bacterium]
MKQFEFSKRLKQFPPYLFAEIDKEKVKLRKKGIDFIDLSVGDPDILCPKSVVEILWRSAKVKVNQKYALDQGKLPFKLAIKKWFKKRFTVTLDEHKEILPLIGSKEGLVHFPLAFLNPDEYVLIPSPGYPGYRGAAFFAGGKVHYMPLFSENGFLPDLNKIPHSVRNKAKIIYLNYPNNPTTALAHREFLHTLVRFSSRYGIIIAYDNAYSELYDKEKPLSILQIPGAKETAIEFHSLSKTFCMTGFRVGWACGNEKMISGLFKVKTNVDSGIFGAIQDAASYALEKENAYVHNLRRTINARRGIFIDSLKKKGFTDIFSESTFYVWVKLAKGTSSIEFAKRLLVHQVVATPGVGFGTYGEGYIRFALTVDEKKLKEALRKI